jgi:hypothetical protein
MMEELCSILAMGCGASTKLVTGSGRLERLMNPKYPREYSAGLARVIGEKTKIAALYDKLP